MRSTPARFRTLTPGVTSRGRTRPPAARGPRQWPPASPRRPPTGRTLAPNTVQPDDFPRAAWKRLEAVAGPLAATDHPPGRLDCSGVLVGVGEAASCHAISVRPFLVSSKQTHRDLHTLAVGHSELDCEDARASGVAIDDSRGHLRVALMKKLGLPGIRPDVGDARMIVLLRPPIRPDRRGGWRTRPDAPSIYCIASWCRPRSGPRYMTS